MPDFHIAIICKTNHIMKSGNETCQVVQIGTVHNLSSKKTFTKVLVTKLVAKTRFRPIFLHKLFVLIIKFSMNQEYHRVIKHS